MDASNIFDAIIDYTLKAQGHVAADNPVEAEHHYRAVITLCTLLSHDQDWKPRQHTIVAYRQARTEAADFIMQREADAARAEQTLLVFAIMLLSVLVNAIRGERKALEPLALYCQNEHNDTLTAFSKAAIRLCALNGPNVALWQRLAYALKGTLYPERKHLPAAYLSECMNILTAEGWFENQVNGIYMVRDAKRETMGADGERQRAWKMACESYALGRGITTDELATQQS